MDKKDIYFHQYLNGRTGDDIRQAFNAGWNARLDRILELKEMLKYLSLNCDNMKEEVCKQIEELLEIK